MTAVIGDVHGCFYTLEALYRRIQAHYPGIDVYCVGDLVDRGAHSFQVIEFFRLNNIRFTPGNHDYMFAAYFREPESLFARSWVFNGNEATLRSYMEHYETINTHIDFIKSAPLYYNLDDCFISHAGISERYKKILPAKLRDNLDYLDMLVNSEVGSESGVLWTREKLLNLGKLQVVGHTNQPKVRVDIKSNSVYIDTGAFLGKTLSAVIISKNEVIDILEEKTNQEDLKIIY